jgi:hypothetical protein
MSSAGFGILVSADPRPGGPHPFLNMKDVGRVFRVANHRLTKRNCRTVESANQSSPIITMNTPT